MPPVISADSILGPVGLVESPNDEGDASDEEDEDGGDGGNGVDPSVRLIDTSPLPTGTTIDEPVTSGNDGPGD